MVGDLGFLVDKGVTKMASGRLEVSLSLAHKRAPKSQLGVVLLLACLIRLLAVQIEAQGIRGGSRLGRSPFPHPFLVLSLFSLT